MARITLEAFGFGRYLTHAFDELQLQSDWYGEGEVFYLEDLGNGRIALGCAGEKSGKFISHAYNKLWLQDGVQGEGEVFILGKEGESTVYLECAGDERGRYLGCSVLDGTVFLSAATRWTRRNA
jgi:hypothetical protein